jgi:hypothetical protein
MTDREDLEARYNAVLEELQTAPTDKLRAEKADLSAKIVEIRQAERVEREARDLAAMNGEGIAQPRPVEGSTEVSK